MILLVTEIWCIWPLQFKKFEFGPYNFKMKQFGLSIFYKLLMGLRHPIFEELSQINQIFKEIEPISY